MCWDCVGVDMGGGLSVPTLTLNALKPETLRALPHATLERNALRSTLDFRLGMPVIAALGEAKAGGSLEAKEVQSSLDNIARHPMSITTERLAGYGGACLWSLLLWSPRGEDHFRLQ